MCMKYYIGIDGGGSNTVGVIGSFDSVAATLTVGPTNYHNIGLEATQNTLKELLEALCETQKITPQDVTAICFGGAGVDTLLDKERLETAIRNCGFTNSLLVCNDALVALAAENNGLNGGILISGTGSIAYGVDRLGVLHRVGGWGHIIDDEGSAYAIARDALKAIMEAVDGRGAKTMLSEVVRENYQLKSVDDIIDFLYGSKGVKHEVAKIATEVSACYEKDQVAKAIIERASKQLIRMIMALKNKLNEECFTLVVCGSVLLKNDTIYKAVCAGVPDSIKIKRLENAPTVGAYILAKQISGGSTV